MIRLKKVLVATDFGEASDQALLSGRELARTFGASLYVLHVVDNVAARYVTERVAFDLPELQGQVEEAAREQLMKIVTDDDRRMLNAQVALCTSVSPATAIVDYARREGIDVIVVGTHGRGTIAHFFMGSVAERVVRTAPCPVLTVHALERDSLASDALVLAAQA